MEQSYGRDDSTVETGGINQVNFNSRVTAGIIDRAGVDLGDSHAVCGDTSWLVRLLEVFVGIVEK